jgi:hypothetical protein
MEQSHSNPLLDGILFLVSAVVTIGLLVVAPEWFWVPLPFVLTYLVRFFKAM